MYKYISNYNSILVFNEYLYVCYVSHKLSLNLNNSIFYLE